MLISCLLMPVPVSKTTLQNEDGAYSKFLAGFEEFTCVMYGQRQFKDVNVLRYMLIKERCGLHDGSINLNKYM